ncbi:hypothetical protein ACQ4WP_21240 [Janthinobacterium sp. GB4P2]|uniref:hypothetical protein n=1 Tax=Janthinobacterium sp. GB4P2 TaxID=3424189 RepID=UPI003F265A14
MPAFFGARKPGQQNTCAESQEAEDSSIFCSICKTDFLTSGIASNQCTNELLAIWEIAASAGGETSFETREKQKKKKKQSIISHNLLFG